MSFSRFVRLLMDAGIWIALGVWIQFYSAKYIQKQIEEGKQPPEAAERLKRNGKWFGWLLILFGIVNLVRALLGHR